MKTAYFILLALFVLALAIRSGYEYLRESGRVIPGSRNLFLFIFSVMMVLWTSWFSLCILDPYKLDLPLTFRSAGLAIFISGLILAFTALFQLKGLEDIDHLVTTGLFARLRHPMYTGFIFWILGWSTFHEAIISLGIGIIGIINILYWRHVEESRLIGQYGDIYQQYRLKTWF
jgi:protein-S-isoprenylcysteine O-methyltransferase Ste14